MAKKTLPKLSVEVKQGQVLLNWIDLEAQTDSLIIITMDAKTKYPELASIGGSSEGAYEILLDESDNDLPYHANSDRGDSTRITLLGLVDTTWKQLCNTGKYSITWVLYKLPKKQKNNLLWDNIKQA